MLNFPAPGATTSGPRASSGAGSGPVAAVVPAPVVCGAGAGYRQRQLDLMLASIYQQKACADINYRGEWSNLLVSMRKVLGSIPNLCKNNLNYHFKVNGYERL